MYVPAVFAVNAELAPTCVRPFIHLYKLPALAISTTEPPWHNVIAAAELIVAAGFAFTVTVVAVDVALQPAAFVTSTVYVPVVFAANVEAVPTSVRPFIHLYELPALAVSTTEPPWQNVVAAAELIVAVGFEFTVTVVAVDVALQPAAFVTSTVYEPAVFAVNVEAVPTCVRPFIHLYEAPALAVSTTEPPWQNVVAAAELIVALHTTLLTIIE